MKKIVCPLALLMFGSILAIAQSRVITGRVADATGGAVAGASVNDKNPAEQMRGMNVNGTVN